MNVFSKQKGLAYYGRYFLSIVIAVLIYGITAHNFFDMSFTEALIRVWYLPLVIPFLIWLYNRMTKNTRTHANQESEEWEFLLRVSRNVQKQMRYKAEDFKALNEDEKFRDFMSDMYKVFKEGESETLNYDDLLARFKEAPEKEQVARIVIIKTKKLREAYILPNDTEKEG